jgi:hypothetical protein
MCNNLQLQLLTCQRLQDVLAGPSPNGISPQATFCAAAPGTFGWMQQIYAAISRRCIPVLVMRDLLNPVFDHLVDWMKISVKWADSGDSALLDELRSIPQANVDAALRQLDQVSPACGHLSPPLHV